MNRANPRTSALLCFGGAFLLALGFALFTDHAWEDYYITFRSSRNLATGHGLVFNPGDRLHTFTSPLGVLLPALASLLTGNGSEAAALWAFRLMSIAAFAGGVVLLHGTVRRLGHPRLAAALAAAVAALDAKSLDFSINGMETGFLLLFLAWTLRVLLHPPPRAWLPLGAAWAGLMWTRPDSFIYIGLLGAAAFLFREQGADARDRRQQLALYLRAGLLTTALYGPWLLWAWWYYGSPIPHTIAAKAGATTEAVLPRLLSGVWRLPVLIWQGRTAVESAFLPSYHTMPAWPAWMVPWGRAVGTLACLAWLLPGQRRETRIASLAFYGGMAYLSFVPYFPFPWYFPLPAWLGYLSVAGVLLSLWSAVRARPVLRPLAMAGGAVVLLGAAGLTLGVARQLRAEQRLIEDGTRRAIGVWLRSAALPGQTLFLEPLGYIGYFSGLKTYDWPGMSSREMVGARRQVGNDWGTLIRRLQPDWLVLRPFEADRIRRVNPGLLTDSYALAREFDASAAVRAVDVPGRAYLEHDAHFLIFHRREPEPPLLSLQAGRSRLTPRRTSLPAGAHLTDYNQHLVTVTGAPASFAYGPTANYAELKGGFGVLDDAWNLPGAAEQVEFRIELEGLDGGKRTLLQRRLDPAREAKDRGFQSFGITFPQAATGRLVFHTVPVGSALPSRHAFWGELAAVPLRTGLAFGEQVIPAASATEARFGFANTEEDGRPCLLAHAPAALVYEWQPGLSRLTAGFGLLRSAMADGQACDGVVFSVEAEDASGVRQVLFRRHLDPLRREADRGEQHLDIAVPALTGGRLILRTAAPPSGSLNRAWSYWRDPQATR